MLPIFAIVYLGNNPKEDLNFANDTFPVFMENIEGQISKITPYDYSLNEIKKKSNEHGLIFPLTLNCNSADYFLYAKKHVTDAGDLFRAEIYLMCSYTETDYFSEKERIMSVSYNNKVSIYIEDLFCFPAVITAYNAHSMFEYALFDESSFCIYYVFLYGVVQSYEGKLKNNIVFDMSLLPTKRLRDSSFNTTLIAWGGYYSIYYV